MTTNEMSYPEFFARITSPMAGIALFAHMSTNHEDLELLAEMVAKLSDTLERFRVYTVKRGAS